MIQKKRGMFELYVLTLLPGKLTENSIGIFDAARVFGKIVLKYEKVEVTKRPAA